MSKAEGLRIGFAPHTELTSFVLPVLTFLALLFLVKDSHLYVLEFIFPQTRK